MIKTINIGGNKFPETSSHQLHNIVIKTDKKETSYNNNIEKSDSLSGSLSSLDSTESLYQNGGGKKKKTLRSDSKESMASSISSTSEESLKSSKSRKDNTHIKSVPLQFQFDDMSSCEDDVIDIEDASSQATSELLGQDPLFLILSQFFMSSETGDNITTVLEKLNKNIEALLHMKTT